MERITKRAENGKAYMVENFASLTTGIWLAIDKLADYEDAEEQGLLLRLQVKPGDTIYQPIGKDINDYKVIGLCYNMAEKEWLYELAIQIGVDWFKTSCPMDCIGKTVFLTKEEAEQKLESMKGE